MLRYVAPIAVFALLIPLFMYGLRQDPTELPSPYIDKPAPAFALPSLHDPDTTVSNADFDDEVALVNVWATWCVGCRQEHAFLLELATRNTVPIFSIDWRDRRADALQWLDQLGNPYVATGFDGDGSAGIDWGVYGAPETFLINRQGIVLHKFIGPLTEEAWQREFVPLIRSARSAAPAQ